MDFTASLIEAAISIGCRPAKITGCQQAVSQVNSECCGAICISLSHWRPLSLIIDKLHGNNFLAFELCAWKSATTGLNSRWAGLDWTGLNWADMSWILTVTVTLALTWLDLSVEIELHGYWDPVSSSYNLFTNLCRMSATITSGNNPRCTVINCFSACRNAQTVLCSCQWIAWHPFEQYHGPRHGHQRHLAGSMQTMHSGGAIAVQLQHEYLAVRLHQTTGIGPK